MQNFRLRLIKKERLRRSLRPEFSHVAAWLSLLVSAAFFLLHSALNYSLAACVGVCRMAPEVVKNEPYSAKVDIWSLGCTVIEMFTGQRPWLTLNQIAALYSVSEVRETRFT